MQHPSSLLPLVLSAVALLTLANPAWALIDTQGEALTEVMLITDAGGQNPKDSESWDIYTLPDPGLHHVVDARSVLGGNEGVARFEADLGMLKAYASATFTSRQQPNVYGGAYGQAGGKFSDEWLISAPGLAHGTPVQLDFTIHIDGSFSGARTQYGTPLLANAAVALEARDKDRTIMTQYFNWNGLDQPVGDYTWSVNTKVGSTLELSAGLSVIARIDNFALTDNVFADFGHTMQLFMKPGVDGVSTVSLGGHDYAVTAVPEPHVLVLLLAGLPALVMGRRCRRHKTS